MELSRRISRTSSTLSSLGSGPKAEIQGVAEDTFKLGPAHERAVRQGFEPFSAWDGCGDLTVGVAYLHIALNGEHHSSDI